MITTKLCKYHPRSKFTSENANMRVHECRFHDEIWNVKLSPSRLIIMSGTPSPAAVRWILPHLSPVQITLSPDCICENSQQSVWSLLPFHFLAWCYYLWRCCFSPPCVTSSSFNLSPSVFILLQVYRHSYMASYSIYNIQTRLVLCLPRICCVEMTPHHPGGPFCTKQIISVKDYQQFTMVELKKPLTTLSSSSQKFPVTDFCNMQAHHSWSWSF